MKYTIEEIRHMQEGQTFDCKSILIEPKHLATIIVAMANADGGMIAVGISDKTRRIEGVNQDKEHLNDILRTPLDFCVPSVSVTTDYVPCTDAEGRDNRVLLMHIPASPRLHANQADEVFWRVGDKSRKLTFDERLQLMYDKGERYYEDSTAYDATLDDIDMDAVKAYMKRIGYGKSAMEYLQENKGFVTYKGDVPQVSAACILLFGKHPQAFFPRARVRFIKYFGTEEKVGREMNVIKDVTLLKLVGFKPIIVHGGGKEISRWVGKVGKEAKFVNGLRVTDAETMEIAEMVLNKVNKGLVSMVQELGVKAVGISGKDGGLLKVDKKYSNGEDIGFVGDIKSVDPKILYDLLERDFLPIVAPIGMDDNFQTYNINADDAACAIAEAVHAEKLVFLSDIEGVYKDKDDPNTLISELHVHEAEKLISEGYVGGGMIPKLQNCIDAIEEGVNRVHILDGRIPHSLLLEIFTNKGIGTAILREDGEKYYDEHE